MEPTAVTVTPVVPDTTDFDQLGQRLVTLAKGVQVTSIQTRASAFEFLGKARALKEGIAERFRPSLEAAQEAKRATERTRKEIDTAWKTTAKPVEEAERIVKGVIGRFDDEQYTLRVEAERKQRLAAAEKQAAEAEATRLQVEAEQLRAKGKLRAAKQAEKQAEESQQVADTVPIPLPPQAAPPKAKGGQSRRVMDWNVVDFAKIPDDFKVLNEPEVRRYANKHGEAAIGTVAGIAFFSKVQVAAQAV